MNTSGLSMAREVARPRAMQAGAAAFLLGAALVASSNARAVDVERAAPVPPAQPAQPAPPVPPAPAAADSRADREAQRQQREERLREAQERLNAAASEVATLAAEGAAEALDNLPSWINGSRRSVIGVQLSADSKDGAKVEDVSPGGPAENAGVRAGDVIVRFNGQDLGNNPSRQIVRLLRDVKPESKVRLRIRRDGKERDIDVVARAFSPEVFAYRSDPPPGFNPGNNFAPQFNFNGSFGMRSELAGLEVTTLTPQLGRYFGTSKGVLVVRAPSNDTLKLQDGDVILSIDGREPTSSSHIARILSSYQPGEQLTLKVMRDRKVQDVVVTLAEKAPASRERARTTWLNGTRM